MKTGQGLEIHHPVLQEMNLPQAMIDMVVCHLPLLREDVIVLLNGVLDYVGYRQNLLSMLLGVSLDTTDLCRMGSPLHLSIIHL